MVLSSVIIHYQNEPAAEGRKAANMVLIRTKNHIWSAGMPMGMPVSRHNSVQLST